MEDTLREVFQVITLIMIQCATIKKILFSSCFHFEVEKKIKN